MKSIVRWVNAVLVRPAHADGGDDRPGLDPATADGETPQSGPVEHLGATETFGAELRALRAVEVSPELVSDIETELQWGHIWHNFDRTMQDQIDKAFAPYLSPPEVRTFDELREQVGLHDAAS